MSTAAILLADIIPSFVIKTISPFLPYNANIRVLISCMTSSISFVVVSFARSDSLVILGVTLTSFAAGLGEPTFLAYSTQFDKNVVSTWSSGTGGAGIFGAVSYSILRAIGLTTRQTLLLMILVPSLELFTFFFILHPPRASGPTAVEQRLLVDDSPQHSHDPLPALDSVGQKISFIPKLMIYFIPLASVYFFEYFINQGLFELMTFPNIWLSTADQYRWYQVTYQIGVFLSRSSVNLFTIRNTWIMAVIQGFIAMLFLTEAIYLYMPTISIVFIVIFIEGLQGGLAYVNTYYRISQEVPRARKELAMNVVASSDSIGIILAGFLAIPTHNWICQMPGLKNSWVK